MVMETMERERERDGPPDRELYALLHLSPEASDDDVKKAYRQWAQVYHPDKHQTPQVCLFSAVSEFLAFPLAFAVAEFGQFP